MKIRNIAKIALVALTVSSGVDYGYRRYQEEPVSRYVSAEIGQASNMGSKNSNMHEFVISLDKNRSGLMRELNITDAQYTNYRNLAIGIAKEETNFGLDYSSTGKKYFTTISKWMKNAFGRKSKTLSEGITNLKFDLIKKDVREKRIMDTFGIKDVSEPAQSAIATIIHLDFLSKQFPTYLKNFPQKPAEQVSLNEYMLARWKGLRPGFRHIREEIISDRLTTSPISYVGKILKSIKK